MFARISKFTLPFFAAVLLQAASASENTVSRQTYEVRGTLKDFNAAKHEATIAHEEIPGFMSAMTMDFEAPDATAFQSLRAGDRLAFRLCVQGERAWIDQVRQIGTTLTVTPPLIQQAVRELKEGEKAPEIEWTDQSSKKTRMRDLRGRALAITFIYSRCPLPTYCPLMNRNFATARILLKQMGAQDNWQMISLSLDAENDTPAVLAAYAKSHQTDEFHWSFATADAPDLRRLGDAVGLEFQRNGAQINHNLRTVVIDVNGRIGHIFRGNSWTPQELVAELRRAMQASR